MTQIDTGRQREARLESFTVSLSVSVALCTFNSALFIEDQLRSILGQSVLPAEIVISDDGSTDDTLTRVQAVFGEYRDAPIALRVLAGEVQLGVTRNFQRAVEACTGDLIALSDHDDVWHFDRLSSAITAFEVEPELLLQHSDARLVDEYGDPLELSLFDALAVSRGERDALAEGRAFDVYLRRNLATGATVLFRQSLLRLALPFPIEWVHDEWLAIVAAAVGRVGFIDQELIDYRQHSGNEIGVEKPTLRYRVKRALQPRGTRYDDLAVRSRVLANRLQLLSVDDRMLQRVREKARFENVRAALPPRRLARLGTVFREYQNGSYERYSSQRNLDVFRDLLQPV